MDRATKAETQANARNIQSGESYRAKMQVKFLVFGGKFSGYFPGTKKKPYPIDSKKY
jgi:hypothetical protein